MENKNPIESHTADKNKRDENNPQYLKIQMTPKGKSSLQLLPDVYRQLSPFVQPPKDGIKNIAKKHQFSPCGLKIIQTPYPIVRNEDFFNTLSNKEGGIQRILDFSHDGSSSEVGSSGSYEDESPEQSLSSGNFSIMQEKEEDSVEEIEDKLKNMNIKPARLNNKSTPTQPPKKKQSTSEAKRQTCNCKKTKCLKLYCDCFRLNLTCEGCNCQGCHNTDDFTEERNNAIMSMIERTPDPFHEKITSGEHVKGCNCKKSNCLKKYCECYQAGLKCGINCKCQECKNKLEPHDKDKEKGGIMGNKFTAKKLGRMQEI